MPKTPKTPKTPKNNDHSEIYQTVTRRVKSSMKRLIFSRVMFIAFFLAIQIGFFLLAYLYLNHYLSVVSYTFTLVGLIFATYILNTERSPYYKVTWIILSLLTPLFGIFFYLWVSFQPGPKAINNRYVVATRRMLPSMRQDLNLLEEVEKQDAGEASFWQYMNHYGLAAAYNNTRVSYMPLGEAQMEAMLQALEKARVFIFMEYFIVDFGEYWLRTLDVLKRKAAEGVEVRFMYDGTCEFMLLPHSYPKDLAKIGINARAFSPLSPLFSTHQNNRDHRKICVIDNKIGFTGGINLADEYINKRERYGHWKDTSVMLEGNGVRGLTMLFLQMWGVGDKVPEENYRRYLKPYSVQAEGYVMPYGDSPLDNENVGQQVYIDILNRAKKYVYICTPYLVIDDQMQSAITYASKRGVDVRLLMPHIPDKKLIFYLGRTFYEPLLESGVRIYEYTPGFVHAKMFVSDDTRGVVGSINLDYRSLYLHFEDAVYMYKSPALLDIRRDLEEIFAKCQSITPETIRAFPLRQKLCGRLLRLIAPLV